MITSDKRIKQEDFGNITDYSAIRPKGMKKFFAYAHFTDMSYCLLSNIFASTRTAAMRIALDRFADCTEYLAGITLHGDDCPPAAASLRPHRAIGGAFFLVYLPDFE